MRSASASSAPTTLSGWLTKSHRGSAAPTHRRFFSSLGYSVSYSRSETSSSSSQTGSFDLRDVELIDEVEPQIIRLQISGKKHPILIALHGAQPEAHAWRRLWASAVPPEAVGERMAAHRSAVLAAKLKERYAAQPRNAQSSSSFSLSRGGSSSLSAKTTPRQMPSTSELQTQDSTLSFVSIGDVTEQAPEAGDPRTPFAAAPAPRPHAVPPINLSQMGESACEQVPPAGTILLPARRLDAVRAHATRSSTSHVLAAHCRNPSPCRPQLLRPPWAASAGLWACPQMACRTCQKRRRRRRSRCRPSHR
mgnify:CR=1 FL=1